MLEEVVHVPVGARLLIVPPLARGCIPFTLRTVVHYLPSRSGTGLVRVVMVAGWVWSAVALCVVIQNRIETNGNLLFGVASRRQKEDISRTLRACFVGCVDHAGTTLHDASADLPPVGG